MGNAGSRCNDSMIDVLVRRDRVLVRNVERAFRLVDRALFLPVEHRPNAYSDVPVKIISATEDGPFFPGPMHLSTTDVYVTALRQLEIEKGHSFLHIGSGIGYFSTVAGFLVGENGENHGIEYYQNLIDYAEERVDEWVLSPGANSAEWTRPQFAACDIYNEEFLEKHANRYDRIYISFIHPSDRIMWRVLRMLKINGVLVAPNRDSLCRFVRVSEKSCTRELLSRMHFSVGVQQPLEDTPTPFFDRVPSLCHLARNAVHRRVRVAAFNENIKRTIAKTILVPKGGRNVPPRHLHLTQPLPLQNVDDPFRGFREFLIGADRSPPPDAPPREPLVPRAPPPNIYIADNEEDSDNDGNGDLRMLALPPPPVPDSPPMNDIRRTEARGEDRFNQMLRGPELNELQRHDRFLRTEAVMRMINERFRAHRRRRAEVAEQAEPVDPFQMRIITDLRALDAPRAAGDLSGDDEEEEEPEPEPEETHSDDGEEPSTSSGTYRKNASHSKRTNDTVRRELAAIRKKRARIERINRQPSSNPMPTAREKREVECIKMRPQRDVVIKYAADEFEEILKRWPLPERLKNFIRLRSHRVDG